MLFRPLIILKYDLFAESARKNAFLGGLLKEKE